MPEASVLGGDETFERVLRAEWALLVKVAQRYRAAEADVNDVLQEAVTKAYVAWRKGRVRDDLARYLTVTVRNVAIGLHRRRRSEARALARLAPMMGVSAQSVGAPDEERIGIDDADVRRAMARLPEPCRQILELRVVRGVPEREVAAQLFIAAGTVKSRCHRCLAKLAQLLGA